MQKIWENGEVKKEKVAITCKTSIQRQINRFDFNNFVYVGYKQYVLNMVDFIAHTHINCVFQLRLYDG